MTTYVENLIGYVPPRRFDNNPWLQAQISYSPDGVQPYTLLLTTTLAPVDSNPQQPLTRNFTVTNVPTVNGFLLVTFIDGTGGTWQADPVQYPIQQGAGAANPTLLSARYAVRHRIRDGIPMLDADPTPFNMVRLENCADQIGQPATPATMFQVRFNDVPTQRFINANVCPGTLVAYVDGASTPTYPTQDVDINGNFVLPVPPLTSLFITYAWQYFSDGEIDQFVDESRQWLREFSQVSLIPDGLVPALVSYASSRALTALATSASRLANQKRGDESVDWGTLQKQFQAEAGQNCSQANAERTAYYTQGPEALDPTVVVVSSPPIGPYTPVR